MNFKNVLLVIAIIVVVIGAVSFLMAHQAHPKLDSKLAITSNDTLTEGDNFTVKLTDVNGTPISNQNVTVTIVSTNSGSVQKTLITDENGEAGFEVDDTATGNCAVKVSYGGNDEFNGCNLTQNVKIDKKVIIIANITNITSNYTGMHDYQIETVEDDYSPTYDTYGSGEIVTYESY